jgi:hypothetical protein
MGMGGRGGREEEGRIKGKNWDIYHVLFFLFLVTNTTMAITRAMRIPATAITAMGHT